MRTLNTMVLCGVMAVASGGQALDLHNRLPNSNFDVTTIHPLLPDFWGIQRHGALGYTDLNLFHFSIDPDMAPPVEGVRVLRLQNGPPLENEVNPPSRQEAQRFGWLVHEQLRIAFPTSEKGQPRTFSVYLRASDPDVRVSLHGNGWVRLAEFPVGTEWQRFDHTFTSDDRLSLSLTGANSSLWIAAPQLEMGEVVTPYRPGPSQTWMDPVSDMRRVPVLRPTRLPRPPRMDGVLEGDVWDDVEPAGDFIGLDGSPAMVPTRAWVAYDDTALYVAIRCTEPAMEHLVARVTERDDVVFGDDSVEVFLSLSETGHPYYQFAVNTLGTQYDASGLGEGTLRWDAEWKTGIHKGDDFWSIEIAIPFASLPVAASDPVWRINMGRNRTADMQRAEDDIWGGQPREHTIWSGIQPDELRVSRTGFHEFARYGRLEGLDPAVLDAYRWSVTDASLDADPSGGFVLSGTVVPGAGQSGRFRLATDWTGTQMRGPDTLDLDVDGAPTPFSLQGLHPRPALGEYPVVFSVWQDDQPRSRLPVRMVPGDTDLRPVRGVLDVYAEYDHVIEDADMRVRANWRYDVPARLTLRLTDADGNAVGVPSVVLERDGKGSVDAVFPVAALPAGRYRISAEAHAGNTVETASDVWSKLPPIDYANVRMNRFTRGLEVEGKPFFPSFLPSRPEFLDASMLQKLRAAGYTTLAAGVAQLPVSIATLPESGPPAEWIADARRHLDRVYAADMRMLVAPTWGWPLREWYAQDESFEGDVERLARAIISIVEPLRDHPAIIGWYLLDEMGASRWEARFGYRESDMVVLYERVKAVDPYRPVYNNWNNTWPLEPYGGVASTDILCHDDYAISHRPVIDPEGLLYATRMINNEAVARRPSLIWTSGSYAPGSQPPPHLIRVHGWMHLVYGTRGIGYWSTHPINPHGRAEMEALNREGQALSSTVFGPRDARNLMNAVHNRRIHYSVWQNGQKAWLFGVNSADVPVAMDLELDAIFGQTPRTVTRMFENDAVRFAEGRLQETFPPFQRRVFVFDLGVDEE